MPLLRIEKLTLMYGATEVLSELTFQVEPRQRQVEPAAGDFGRADAGGRNPDPGPTKPNGLPGAGARSWSARKCVRRRATQPDGHHAAAGAAGRAGGVNDRRDRCGPGESG